MKQLQKTVNMDIPVSRHDDKMFTGVQDVLCWIDGSAGLNCCY